MLILLTLSFLPTSNRNSSMLGILREAPKKQFSVPPHIRGSMIKKADIISDSNSHEIILNYVTETPNAPFGLSKQQVAPYDLSQKHMAPYDLFKKQGVPFHLFKKENALYELFKKPRALYYEAKKSSIHYEVSTQPSRELPDTQAPLLKEGNSETESEEINKNTHNVHVANSPVKEKNEILNIIQNITGIVISAVAPNPQTDSEEVNTNNTHAVFVAERPPVVRKGFGAPPFKGIRLRNTSLEFNPPPDAINQDAESKKRFGISLTKTGTIVLDEEYDNIQASQHEINSALNTMEAAKKLIPSALVRTSLAPGDVLNGQILTNPPDIPNPYIETFNKEMNARSIGYLSVGFEELCDIVASKRTEHIYPVSRHTEDMVEFLMYRHSRLLWLDEPMSMILHRVALVISISPMDELQTRAVIMKALMKDRRRIVGNDVNEALDEADSLIKKEDGERLFHVLQEFRHYPNGSKNGVEMCRAIIQAFENPFLRHQDTELLWTMVTKANQAFIDRFPEYENAGTDRAKFLRQQGQAITNLKPNSKVKEKNHLTRNKKGHPSKSSKTLLRNHHHIKPNILA